MGDGTRVGVGDGTRVGVGLGRGVDVAAGTGTGVAVTVGAGVDVAWAQDATSSPKNNPPNVTIVRVFIAGYSNRAARAAESC